MAGRDRRSKLLAPSFLLLTSALACDDGSTEPPPPRGSAGGGLGNQGGPPYLLVTDDDDSCPTSLPTERAPCTSAGVCAYQSKTCELDGVNVACVDGGWKLWRQPGACNPPDFACPEEAPPVGGDCFGADECSYGFRCDARCADGRWLALQGSRCEAAGGAGGAGGAEN